MFYKKTKMNLRKKSQDFKNVFKENESLKRENVFLNKENGELKSSFSKHLKEKKILDISHKALINL